MKVFEHISELITLSGAHKKDGRKLVEAGARYVTYFIPIPFPGSRLYDIAISEGYLKPDFDPDIMNWKRPVMKNTVVPPERLLELRDWAWQTTNRPDYIEQRLKSNLGTRLNYLKP